MAKQIRRGCLIGVAMLLSACGRVDRPGGQGPIARPSAQVTAQCLGDLRALGVAFRVLPDKDFGNGCGLAGTVQLLDIGVPVTGLGAMRCGEARAFAGWVRGAVAPAAYQLLGSELVRVDTFGSYACRNVIGSAGNTDRRSGHAIANAVDVAGVRLADGRRISVLADWRSTDPAVLGFWQAVHRSACKRFGTVLSPDYNAAHANHLHLEDDAAQFCH